MPLCITQMIWTDFSISLWFHTVKCLNRGIYSQLPGQLSKKEKKYFLSAVSDNARMREYAESFRWLDESRIVNIARNATDPDIALAMSEDFETQKLYSSDAGLLITQAFANRPYTENELYRALMLDKLSVTTFPALAEITGRKSSASET